MKNKTYTLYFNGDLISEGKHNRKTFNRFIKEGLDLLDLSGYGMVEVFSEDDNGHALAWSVEEN